MDHHTYKEFAQFANKDSANKDSPKLPKAFTASNDEERN